MRGRPAANITKKTKYTLKFDDSIWYYDLSKSSNSNLYFIFLVTFSAGLPLMILNFFLKINCLMF